MSKKNDRSAIKKRHNIVKKQMMEQQRRCQERQSLKQLCRNMKLRLENVTLGAARPSDPGQTVEEVEMAVPKSGPRGVNFLRELGTGEVMTARRKKVLKQALKRRKKTGM